MNGQPGRRLLAIFLNLHLAVDRGDAAELLTVNGRAHSYPDIRRSSCLSSRRFVRFQMMQDFLITSQTS
jgi:hypothetical protein